MSKRGKRYTARRRERATEIYSRKSVRSVGFISILHCGLDTDLNPHEESLLLESKYSVNKNEPINEDSSLFIRIITGVATSRLKADANDADQPARNHIIRAVVLCIYRCSCYLHGR